MVTNDFIELLEILAMEKKTCEIVFSDSGGKVSINQRIEGVYDRGDHLVLQIQSGREIPVEHLIRVDGISAENVG